MLHFENEFKFNMTSKDKLSKSTIKIDNLEISEESLRKMIKEHPELLDIKKERPLGDDFSMLGYLRDLDSTLSGSDLLGLDKTEIRINALIKIWEWKEKNDEAFGDKEVFNGDIRKCNVCYSCYRKELDVTDTFSVLENTELPYFSSKEIAKKALKELEAEYKVVFNVA